MATTATPTPLRPTPIPLRGLGVTGLTPDSHSAWLAAMLVALLADEGANVAAMVPVETGIPAPCSPESHGAWLRWAAGHLDDPRLVTPFAFASDMPPMLAAQADDQLLHTSAFERARERLCDQRTALVVSDAVGPLDPITPSLTMLDLLTRWRLDIVVAARADRHAVGHVRALLALLAARELRLAGVVLTPPPEDAHVEQDAVEQMQATLAGICEKPVLVLLPTQRARDRATMVETARAAGLTRLLPRVPR
jgi:dethiobiotin synthetase